MSDVTVPGEQPPSGGPAATRLRTVGLAVAIGAAAFVLGETVLPEALPGVTVALVAGLVVGGLLAPDIDAASAIVKRVLPVAIVLVGLRVSFSQVRELGLETLALVVAGLAVGLGAALLAARLLGVGRRLGILLALGTAICGNTAIVAGAPIVRARREEIAYAVATITAFGTAAVLLLPPLGRALGLDDVQLGIWAGVGVNDTSQVLAAAFAFSDAAGETATVVKLVRNAFLGVILIGLAVVAAGTVDAATARRRLGRTLGVPWFVWGFAAAVALASLEVVPDGAVDASQHVARVLILVVLAAVGLSVRPSAMRAVGVRPFVVGLAAMTCLSAVVLAAVLAGVGS